MEVSDRLEDLMDDEEREVLEMTKDELLARAAKGTPVEGARSKPKTRNREDFAQRMHRVVGETIERSEREEVDLIVARMTPASMSRRLSQQQVDALAAPLLPGSR
jgi:hypothetical protein